MAGPTLTAGTSTRHTYVAIAACVGDHVGHAADALRAPPSARLACGHVLPPAYVHEGGEAFCQLLHALHVQHRVNALLNLMLLVSDVQLPHHRLQNKYT